MAIPLQYFLLFSLLTLSQVTAATLEATVATTTAATHSAPAPPPQTFSHEFHENSFFSHTALLAPILSHLGFNELATAAPSLSVDTSSSSWSGPSTLFAPSDSSLHTCLSCSVPNLLREHIVPGLYTIDYLRKLAFGTKIETLSPGRCLTVTSTSFRKADVNDSNATVKVFVGGVEITHPELFNNGLIIIHGIQGYVAPLSPFSCDVERLNSLTFPLNHQQQQQQQTTDRFSSRHQFLTQSTIMRLMLRDSVLRLRNNGFSILSLAMRVKYGELASLSNMTVFALDDASIFTGSHSYISSIRFHIVPNVYLSASDLEKLPLGATLPTLERGQSLVVTSTTASGGSSGFPMRINYVRVKGGDLIRNLKIVVHSIYLPFPRIDPAVVTATSGFDGPSSVHATVGGSCDAVMEENGSCTTASGSLPDSQLKPPVDLDEYHGL